MMGIFLSGSRSVRDLPDFELGEEIADYIEQIEEIVESYKKQQ